MKQHQTIFKKDNTRKNHILFPHIFNSLVYYSTILGIILSMVKISKVHSSNYGLAILNIYFLIDIKVIVKIDEEKESVG
jgi:hypothetical protein